MTLYTMPLKHCIVTSGSKQCVERTQPEAQTLPSVHKGLYYTSSHTHDARW